MSVARSAASDRRMRFGFTASQNFGPPFDTHRPKARSDRVIRKAVQQLRVQAIEFFRIEMRGRAADLREIEFLGEFIERAAQLDGIGGAGLGRDRSRAPAARSRPRGFHAKRASRCASTKPRRRSRSEAGEMREFRYGRAQRLEYLDLRRGVGDVVLATHDMRHREVYVVQRPTGAYRGSVRLCGSRPDRRDARLSISTSPRMRSSHFTLVWLSLKRQCGLRPSLPASHDLLR